MSQLKNQSESLKSIDFVRDISPETASNYSGGALAITDVTLFSEDNAQGLQLGTNKKIEDLSDFGFNDATAFVAVNNGQTWRFYEDADFQGNFIDVGPDEARNVGDFGMKISSLRSIS
jgi:hypothetical protein